MKENKYYIKKKNDKFFNYLLEKPCVKTNYVVYKKHDKDVKYTAGMIASISAFMFVYEVFLLRSQEYIPEDYFKLWIWFGLLLVTLPFYAMNYSDEEIKELSTKRGAEEYIKYIEVEGE